MAEALARNTKPLEVSTKPVTTPVTTPVAPIIPVAPVSSGMVTATPASVAPVASVPVVPSSVMVTSTPVTPAIAPDKNIYVLPKDPAPATTPPEPAGTVQTIVGVEEKTIASYRNPNSVATTGKTATGTTVITTAEQTPTVKQETPVSSGMVTAQTDIKTVTIARDSKAPAYKGPVVPKLPDVIPVVQFPATPVPTTTNSMFPNLIPAIQGVVSQVQNAEKGGEPVSPATGKQPQPRPPDMISKKPVVSDNALKQSAQGQPAQQPTTQATQEISMGTVGLIGAGLVAAYFGWELWTS